MLPRQHQLNQREIAKLDIADRDLKTLSQTLDQLRTEAQLAFKARLVEEQSANADVLRRYDDLLAAPLGTVEEHVWAISDQIRRVQTTVAQAANHHPRPRRVMPASWPAYRFARAGTMPDN